MTTATRRSPLADWHATHAVEWCVRESMAMPLVYRDALAGDAPVRLQDVSWQQRFGCKGPEASRWLKLKGLNVPEPANSWADDKGILVARLATSEFLIEALGSHQSRIADLRSLFPVPEVYPVIRQDAAFVLRGKRARDLLLQTCSFNFGDAALTYEAQGGTTVLTSMVGVGVTIIPRAVGMVREYRIWCDPSFGLYLWSTLVGIAREMGGGAVADEQQSGTASRGDS